LYINKHQEKISNNFHVEHFHLTSSSCR
jgi:hypothetical protein